MVPTQKVDNVDNTPLDTLAMEFISSPEIPEREDKMVL